MTAPISTRQTVVRVSQMSQMAADISDAKCYETSQMGRIDFAKCCNSNAVYGGPIKAILRTSYIVLLAGHITVVTFLIMKDVEGNTPLFGYGEVYIRLKQLARAPLNKWQDMRD